MDRRDQQGPLVIKDLEPRERKETLGSMVFLERKETREASELKDLLVRRVLLGLKDLTEGLEITVQ